MRRRAASAESMGITAAGSRAEPPAAAQGFLTHPELIDWGL